MYVQKGFVANTLFTSNNPGVVAKLGEMSPLASTFAREKGIYTDSTTAQNLVITSFISKDNTTTIPVPALISKQMLEIANTVYSMTANGQIDVDAQMLLENLIVSYTGKAEDFSCGEMVSDGVHILPEWVSWKTTVDTNRPDNFIKLWFTDEAFTQQYDEYEIYVVPPFDVLDNFFLSGFEVEEMLKARTSAESTDRMQVAKQGYPETIIRTNTFTYYDPNNPNHTVDSDWGILIYGNAGNNIDSIKDALMNHILSHSAHNRVDWIKILPDIFKRTEFILIPLWDQYAIPDRHITAGIYSPQVNLTSAVATAKQFASLPTGYPEAHIDSQLMVMGHPYKSIAVASIGSPDNRNNQFKLSEVFPDLIAVTSTSADFNRMTKNTQDWASMFATMLVEAERMSEFSTLPDQAMMKVHRDGKLYLARSYKNINYLVVAKSNFPDPGN